MTENCSVVVVLSEPSYTECDSIKYDFSGKWTRSKENILKKYIDNNLLSLESKEDYFKIEVEKKEMHNFTDIFNCLKKDKRLQIKIVQESNGSIIECFRVFS